MDSFETSNIRISEYSLSPHKILIFSVEVWHIFTPRNFIVFGVIVSDVSKI